MDWFLAIIRLQGHNHSFEEVSRDVAKAVEDYVGEPQQNLTHFADANLIFASTASVRGSDAAIQMSSNRSLIYVNGPLSLLGSSIRPVARESAGQIQSQVDGRLSDLRSAVKASLEGLPGLEDLTGSFHGLLYDGESQHTVALTDRLGSRPIFFFQTASLLCLASDIRLLLALPMSDCTLDYASLVELVRFQMIMEDRTLYRAIKVLPPATLLSVDHRNDIPTQKQYWRLTKLSPFTKEEEAVEATAHAFCAATPRILDGSKRASVLLSGGLDSRMILACLPDQKDFILEAHTFGPRTGDETPVARRVAQLAGVRWGMITQEPSTYWDHMPRSVESGNGLHSFYHAHTSYPTSALASAGFDTVLLGFGFDNLYSGTLFPREKLRVLGRELYSFRLAKVSTVQEVHNYLVQKLDLQKGDFGQSTLGESLRGLWEDNAPEALHRMLAEAQSRSDVPYDWIDYTFYGVGGTKFRAFPVIEAARHHLRARSPIFENEVLEVFQRLPYQWRFLGPVFRRALFELSPALAKVTYSNVGTSPLAHPFVQAVSQQANAFRRANWSRLSGALRRVGAPVPPARPHGSYPSPGTLAGFLSSGEGLPGRVRRLMLEGPLVQAGLVNAEAVQQGISHCRADSGGQGLTLLALATLALWIDTYPARFA